MNYSSDVAFTPAVKAIQERKGSRANYARMEEAGSWQTIITPDLKLFIEAQTSVFLATANAQGQPYIQHRGGPPGFLRVLDEATLGFVDFVGKNPKAHLFLIHYAHRRRVKVWGEARVVEDDQQLATRLMPGGYKARPSQVILFKILAWDSNCPQHIPQRLEASDVATVLAERDRRIAQLEAQVALRRTAGVRADRPNP